MKLAPRPFAFALLALALPLLAGAAAETQPAKTDAKTEKKADDAKAEKKADAKPAKEATKKADAAPTVVIKTSMGEITVKLNPEKAPISVENFLKYVDQKHFDGTIFHRVMSDFMIQGGGFNPDMTQKKTMDPIKLESGNGLSNKRGTIAMARTNVPDSATSQFFINVVDNQRLDAKPGGEPNGYAVFGEVTAGMDVVDKIRAVPVGDKGGHQNVPTTVVTIESVRRK